MKKGIVTGISVNLYLFNGPPPEGQVVSDGNASCNRRRRRRDPFMLRILFLLPFVFLHPGFLGLGLFNLLGLSLPKGATVKFSHYH